MRNEAWRRHSQSLRRLAFYLWSMCALSHAAAAMAAAQPGQVTPLELKLPISRRVAGAEMHFYRVPLRAGEFMRVRVDQKGVDISVTVHGDDGHVIAVMNSPNEKEGPEVLSFIAERTAMYFVRVKPVTQGRTQDGEYTLVLEDVRAATPRDHQQVQGGTRIHGCERGCD